MSASQKHISVLKCLRWLGVVSLSLPFFFAAGCGAGLYPYSLDPKPILVLSSTHLDFGAVPATTASQPLVINATNTGNATLTFSSIALTGANPSQFTVTTNCGSSLAAGANCAASVVFSPGATGSYSASLTFTDNATGSPQAVTLTGAAIAAPAPVVALTPTSLNFGSVNVGTTSATQTATLSNTGNGPLNISTAVLGGAGAAAFSFTTTCSATLAAQQSCSYAFTFKPTAAGAATTTFTLTDNAANSPQTIALTGTGVAVAALTITPKSLTFPATAVGVASTAQTVTLTNTGSANITFSSITLGGANPSSFGDSTACATITPTQSCTIAVTFQPTAIGALTATLSIADNVTGSPQTVTISGTGTGTPTAILNPTSLNFGGVTVKTASAAQTVTLSNTGNAPLAITSFAFSGAGASSYSQTNNCGATVAAAGSCTISIVFTPTTTGALPATLTVTDNATPTTQTVALTGTGGSGPAVTLTPSSLSFGSVVQGVTSAPQTATLTNTGGVAVTIASIGITGTGAADFADTTTCGAMLAIGANCTIAVTFTPTTTGSFAATLSVADNAGTQTVALSGTGQAAPIITLTPATVNFGANNIGVTTAAKIVTAKNTGTGPATISSITITGTGAAAFTDTTTCGATLAAGATCTISITFKAPSGGKSTAKLNVADNATGSPQTVTLNGTGNGPNIVLTPATLAFAKVKVGVTSAAKTVTVTNSGNAAATLNSETLVGTNASSFVISANTCGATLAAAATCSVDLEFKPTASGALTADLSVADNATGTPASPQTVTLTGTGTAPAVTLSPTSLTFPSTKVGVAATKQTITLTNSGNATLAITSISITGTDASSFSDTENCPVNLAAAATCTITVGFKPTAAGPLTAAVTLVDNAPDTPQSAPLSGTGAGAAVITLAPTALTFAGTNVGSTSAAQTITIANTGGASATITSVSITGTDPTDFAETNNCGATLAAGASCTASITFTPAAAGSFTAKLSVADNVTGSPQTATLTGTGNGAALTIAPKAADFGNVALGTTSTPLTLTLTSTGNIAVAFTSFTLTGANDANFTETNNCPASLAPAATCTVTLTFTPTKGGHVGATLNIADNVTGSPQTVALNGTGTGPAVTLAPTSLAFTSTAIGTKTAAKTVTVTNSGSATLTITGITLGGTSPANFAETNTCTAPLAAAATCTISVTFTGSANGTVSATLLVADDAYNSPQSVPLTGEVSNGSSIKLSPTSIAFADTAVGASSATSVITLTNTGTATADISSIAIGGANASSFIQTATTCGATLAKAASCTVTLKFTPSTTGPLAGSLIITDDATGSPQTAALTGNGTAATKTVTLTPATLTYASTNVGQSSAAQVATLTNTGSSFINISSITLTGTNATSYTNTTTCGATLAVAATCKISIIFKPTTGGTLTATLSVADDATGIPASPQTVALSGTGSTSTGSILTGIVKSGTASPVAASKVAIYAVQVPGGSTKTLLATTTTAADGTFSFLKTGATAFTCPAATTPVYLIATGGTPTGVTAANPDLIFMSFLGYCGSLTTAVVNEATTVASVSALAPFITSTTSITYTTGLAPVFATAAANALYFADPTTGIVPGTLPSGTTVDTTKINSLADILYTCAHSKGGISGDGSACGSLFAATNTPISTLGATAAADTFQAILNIELFVPPWIKGVGNLLGSTQPFTPVWTSTPGDLIPRVLTTTVAATFSPAAGNFTTGVVSVTLSSTTLGAGMYYTTDGTNPTVNSTKYLAPIALNKSGTIKAIAIENGFTVSSIAQSSYIISGSYITLSIPSASLPAVPGKAVSGTITLSAPSTSALTVTLTSGAPLAVAVTTATVQIPAGSTTGTFTLNPKSAGSVLITATATNYGEGVIRVPSTMLTTSPTVTSKLPIVGFTAMGYENFNNNPKLAVDNLAEEINADPGLFVASTMNVRWSDLEPTQGSYDFSSIETGIAAILASNKAHGQSVVGKIRVFTSSNLPSYLIPEEGGGVYVQDGAGGAVLHDALFWSTDYELHFTALVNAMGVEYDSRAAIQEMAATACASDTMEPFIVDITTMTTGYLTNPSMRAQGYTDAAMMTCLEHEAQDYSAWSITPLYLPFSPWRSTDLLTKALVLPSFSLEEMHAWVDQLGTRAIAANNALSTEASLQASAGEGPIYLGFPYVTQWGGHVGMQTNAQGALDMVCTNSGTGDDFVCWDPTVAYGIKQTGREIELWETTNAPFAVNKGTAQISIGDIQIWNAKYF